MLKLYYHPASTFARRVRMQLLEKDLPHELIALDMAAGAHRQPEYRALNPYGRVPTLVDGDLVLYESNAILCYLEAAHPHPPLLPRGLHDRARVDMHMRLCDVQMGRHAGTILFPKRFLPRERWNLEAIAAAKVEVEKHCDILARELSGREYLVAGQFTLAEVAYAPFLQFFALMEITPPPAVAQWSERILARPSARATVPEH
jgi:glutathione S-transferase